MAKASHMMMLFLLLLTTAVSAVDTQRIEQHVQTLTKLPHRLAGTQEGRQAGDYIISQLKAGGVEKVLIQPIPVLQLRCEPTDCYLEHDGQKIPMQPIRPNGIALPVTPPAGIVGQTVYLGDGRWERFNGVDLKGRIAVLDFAAGSGWQRAFSLGASAVIFVGPATETDPTAGVQWSQATAQLPRYYLDKDVAQSAGLLSGANVKLFCRMGWQLVEGRNIFALIEGTGPQEGDPPLISVACEYDTYGTMPFNVPATRNAANVAGAIETAIELQKNPTSSSSLVCFFDNNAQSNFGQWWFYFARGSYEGDDPTRNGTLAWIIDQRDRELALIEQRLKMLEKSADLVAGNLPDDAAELEGRQLLDDLEQRYNTYKDESFELKIELQRLQKDLIQTERDLQAAEAADKPDSERIKLLKAAIERTGRMIETRQGPIEERTAQLDANKLEMAKLKRQFESRNISEESQTLFDSIIRERIERIKSRKVEAQREVQLYRASQSVAEQLDQYRLVMMAFLDLAPIDQGWTLCVPSMLPAPMYKYASSTNGWSSAADAVGFVTNPQMTNWLRERMDDADARGARWPNCLGIPQDVLDDSPEISETSGMSTYLLKFGHVGLIWPNAGLPTESPVDAAAYTTHLTEALNLFRLCDQQEAIGRARVLKRSGQFGYLLPQWVDSQARYKGCTANRYGGTSVEADVPVKNAIIKHGPGVRAHQKPLPHRFWGRMQMSTVDGNFKVMAHFGSNSNIVAALYDDGGHIQTINQLRAGGYQGQAGWNAPSVFWTRKDLYLSMFDARGTVLFHSWAPFREIRGGAGEPRVLDGISNIALKRMNLTIDDELLAVWAQRPQTIKYLASRLLLLGGDSANPIGRGLPFTQEPIDTYSHATNDLWTLNEDRLGKLRRHGVMQNSLEELHARAENHLIEAKDQTAADPGAAFAERSASLAYSGVAYEPIRTVTNDLIKAVVILLLLAIPFAFALERLVIGTANVYRQIGGFIVIFLVVFGILYVVHPAFRFAAFPIVVLLAFVIIIMSSMVIYIMWTKFEYEIRSFQGIATASHRSSRSSRGTVAAAVGLGISTMRRRPLRTFLTALTIILLTFTILFFGAFNTEMGVRKVLAGPGRGERRIELTLTGGKELQPSTILALRTLYKDDAQSYLRQYAFAPFSSSFIGRLAASAPFMLDGYTTVDPKDIQLYPSLRAALSGDIDGFAKEGGIFLPVNLYQEMRKDNTPMSVQFSDRELVVRGSFDPQKLLRARTIEGASFVPPDVAQMQRILELQNPQDDKAREQKLSELEMSAFPLLDASLIALVSPVSDRIDMPASTLVLLPRNDDAALRIAGEIAAMIGGSVTVNAAGEISRVLYTQQLASSGRKGKSSSFAGFAKLFVPLLLGGLIIFSTMLSSVADREREIFTFSALGLAPVHVSVLFFAEAAVYAVIGGLGGYLFSQLFGKTVEQMAIWGWVTAPAMNYSSMNAMAAILVVMLTVVVSTIYPAFKASRSANPGIQRRWKMPKPEDGSIDVLFPFTVSEYDLVGLITFLEEYFLSHQERSVGSFAADSVEVEHTGQTFTLKAVTWLQPFDQGVSQNFEMRTESSDIEGIDQVRIVMQRVTGSPAIWERSSKVFINDIRQQFIFWRTIDDEMMDHYRQMTARRFGLDLEQHNVT